MNGRTCCHSQVQLSLVNLDLAHLCQNVWIFLERRCLLDFVGQYSMMIEWKEGGHELVDLVAMGNNHTLVALLDCGLLKSFRC